MKTCVPLALAACLLVGADKPAEQLVSTPVTVELTFPAKGQPTMVHVKGDGWDAWASGFAMGTEPDTFVLTGGPGQSFAVVRTGTTKENARATTAAKMIVNRAGKVLKTEGPTRTYNPNDGI
jgi:hypothetical protein